MDSLGNEYFFLEFIFEFSEFRLESFQKWKMLRISRTIIDRVLLSTLCGKYSIYFRHFYLTFRHQLTIKLDCHYKNVLYWEYFASESILHLATNTSLRQSNFERLNTSQLLIVILHPKSLAESYFIRVY